MTTINRQVSASTDDCVRRLTPSWFSLTYVRFWCGDGAGGFYDYRSGARFLNITIPKAANIVSAYLKLKAEYYTTSRVNSIIRGEDADDAATFSTSGDYDGRARTSANVAWTPPAWVIDTWYNSPNIKTIIQEIVNRGGWASGHDLVIFWEDAVGFQNVDETIARDYNQLPANAPKLEITYTTPVAHEKVLTESLGFVDTVVKAPSLIKSEPLGLVDVYSRIWTIQRAYSELLGLVDVYSRAWTIYRTYSELLALVDSVQKEPGKMFVEPLGLVDTYSRAWSIYRAYSELLGLLDSIQKGQSKDLSEPLGLVDTYSRVQSIHRTYTELLELSDLVSKDVTLHPLTETLGLLDSIQKKPAKTFNEKLGVADTFLQLTWHDVEEIIEELRVVFKI